MNIADSRRGWSQMYVNLVRIAFAQPIADPRRHEPGRDQRSIQNTGVSQKLTDEDLYERHAGIQDSEEIHSIPSHRILVYRTVTHQDTVTQITLKDSRCQDDGYGIIQRRLSEDESVEVSLDLLLVQNSQDRN